MIPDIRSKLNDCLGEKNYSERDVVYILIQSYKLLERKGKRDNFPTIIFYRNWVCHAVLYGYKEIFKPVIDNYKNGFENLGNIDLASDEIRESFKKFSPKKLREELDKLIEQFISPYLVSVNTLDWNKFREGLYEVIKDIKIVVKDDKDTEKEIFSFECRELLGKVSFDDLRIGVEMGGVSFEFHVQDGTL